MPGPETATRGTVSVAIWRVEERSATGLPRYMTAGAAGCDLTAALEAPLDIGPGDRALVPTGWAIALPAGFEGQVRPRSGLAVKTGLTVLNAPGTIDADYRGEIRVALVNLGSEAVRIRPGDRIAQLVVAPVVRVVWDERTPAEAAATLATVRGAAGFGHTGLGDAQPGARSAASDEGEAP